MFDFSFRLSPSSATQNFSHNSEISSDFVVCRNTSMAVNTRRAPQGIAIRIRANIIAAIKTQTMEISVNDVILIFLLISTWISSAVFSIILPFIKRGAVVGAPKVDVTQV